MRKVEYYSRAFNDINGKRILEKEFEGFAIFHCFGVDCEEFNHGVGTFSVAILELDDGSLISVPVDLVKFVNAE